MAEAEDATQGAMEALLGRFEHVQKNPAPYVRVSAKNLWRRARSTSPSVHPSGVGAELGAMLALEPHLLSRAPETDPAEAQCQESEQKWALQMISVLPPTQRQALALTLDGFGPSEIAVMTGKPSTTVRANLAHARRRLRVALVAVDARSGLAGPAASIEPLPGARRDGSPQGAT